MTKWATLIHLCIGWRNTKQTKELKSLQEFNHNRDSSSIRYGVSNWTNIEMFPQKLSKTNIGLSWKHLYHCIFKFQISSSPFSVLIFFPELELLQISILINLLLNSFLTWLRNNDFDIIRQKVFKFIDKGLRCSFLFRPVSSYNCKDSG